MRFHRLDLNLLLVLDTLLTELSVSRTAVRLHLGQPAVSAALARLREHFNDQLVVPVGRRLVPTPLAQNLSGPVKEVLQRMHAIVYARADFDPMLAERRFSITASDYSAVVLLPTVNRILAERAPGIHLTIRQPPMPQRHTTPPVVESLDRRGNDFAIVPVEICSDAHSQERLLIDSYTCIVWDENKLAGTELTLEKYLSMTHAIAEFGDGVVQSRDSMAIEKLGCRRRIGAIVESFTQLPELVAGTQMIATLPTRLARMMSKRLPLRLLTSPVKVPDIVETLQWHQFKDHDQAMVWLRGVLKEVAGML